MASGRSQRLSNLAISALAAVLVAGVVAYAAHGAHLRSDNSFQTVARPQLPVDLKDGDLVFRAGRDMMARLVLSQGDATRFSHVGVIVMHGHKAFVVHAVPAEGLNAGGVREEPLAEFSKPSNASDIGFFRVSGLDDRGRQEIVDYALEQIGKPFDDEYRFSDDSRMYCTELVLKALVVGEITKVSSTGSVQVLTLNEPVFPPDSLRRSPELVEVASFADAP